MTGFLPKSNSRTMNTPISYSFMWLVLWLALQVGLSLPPTLGAQTLTAELALQPGKPSIWADGIGNGFRQDTLHAGFALGAGFGTRTFGTTRDHDIALGSAH